LGFKQTSAGNIHTQGSDRIVRRYASPITALMRAMLIKNSQRESIEVPSPRIVRLRSPLHILGTPSINLRGRRKENDDTIGQLVFKGTKPPQGFHANDSFRVDRISAIGEPNGIGWKRAG
jgi:hypothetical protein